MKEHVHEEGYATLRCPVLLAEVPVSADELHVGGFGGIYYFPPGSSTSVSVKTAGGSLSDSTCPWCLGRALERVVRQIATYHGTEHARDALISAMASAEAMLAPGVQRGPVD